MDIRPEIIINNVELYLSYVIKAAEMRKYHVAILGFTEKYPIYLIHPHSTEGRPTVLIAAGFHGEEPAGCWGLLDFLETADDKLFIDCSISFLPLINPTGLERGTRYNIFGENPNNGFCHTPSKSPEPSMEGEILIKNISILKKYGKDSFLSLHEDIDCTEFYIYTFENNNFPGEFSNTLKQTEELFFNPLPDGVIDGAQISNGIIYKHCDGSFEDLMFHEGIPRTACTETPGKLDFPIRVTANKEIIKSFVNYHIEMIKR